MNSQISIITSLYHTEQYLTSFIANARKLAMQLSQHGVGVDFVLVSNEPTPAEAKILDALSAPFHVLKVPRESIYASWNRGIHEAQGEYVSPWGVDDVRFADSIIEAFTDMGGNFDVAYFPFTYKRYVNIFGFRILAKVKTFIPPVFEKARFSKEMHCGPHFIVHKTVFDRVGYFDESFRIAGDYEWCARAARLGAHFVRGTKKSGIFTNDGTTLSGSRATLHREENERIKNTI